MKKYLKKILFSEQDTLNFAGKIAQAIKAGAVIFLNGPLGAGKTTFARGFLRSLGYNGKVKSPTYTIVEPYEINGRHIFHFDFYRVQHSQELEHIGIQEYFFADSICLIEWPEKAFPLLPVADLICHLSFVEEGREIWVEANSESGKDMLERN